MTNFDASDYERPARSRHDAIPEDVARQARDLQALVERRPLLDVRVALVLPSSANLREHFRAKAKRAAMHRALGFSALEGVGFRLRTERAVVLLVREAPRTVDSDNLASAAKNFRDGIADALGIDDRSPRVGWCYAQAKAKVAAVRVVIVEGPK